MIIANPIYDVAFKRLLENDRTAKFLIGTILDCKVLSLEPATIEYTDIEPETKKPTLFRMDFAATIDTKEEGKKRVIIELQKAKNLGDVSRFQKYLGNEYRKTKHPIIAIYILGFDLSVESPAFMARPDCWDLMTHEKIEKKDSFVEQLTHKAYFVQTKRIKPSFNTRLEKLLSAFEQNRFVGDNTTTKHFPYETDDPEIKEILDILHYVASDEETRKELDKENYYQDAMEEIFGEQNRKMEKLKKEMEEKDAELEKERKEKAQKDEALAKQAAEIAELKRKLAEKKG